MNKKYDVLKIENQMCFPLYACSKEIIRRNSQLYEDLGLTYTQYITMLVLWEKGCCTVTELGRNLFLDSGTLTPLLKKLEAKGLLTRARSASDERNLNINLTQAGEALKDRALQIPDAVSSCIGLDDEEKVVFTQLLHKVLSQLGREKE